MSKMQTWGGQKDNTQGCHFTLGWLHSSRAEALLTSQTGRRPGRGAPHFPDGAADAQPGTYFLKVSSKRNSVLAVRMTQ
uniref:Uncharacterized protein n=1 Tax=Gorilla gorilla gorilla TaxID=9595 RepID=G3SDM1_GORGO